METGFNTSYGQTNDESYDSSILPPSKEESSIPQEEVSNPEEESNPKEQASPQPPGRNHQKAVSQAAASSFPDLVQSYKRSQTQAIPSLLNRVNPNPDKKLLPFTDLSSWIAWIRAMAKDVRDRVEFERMLVNNKKKAEILESLFIEEFEAKETKLEDGG